MVRTKIGDVYYVKLPNGLKIIQWAYSVPKYGDFVRVFKGLWEEVPQDIDSVIAGEHSYIIAFDVKKAYRVGLSKLIGNFTIPEEYPFPEYMISFYRDFSGQIFKIRLKSTGRSEKGGQSFSASKLEEIPLEFQNVKLINGYMSMNWILYLFDIDFDLTMLPYYYPGSQGEEWEKALAKYTEICSGGDIRE